MNISKGLEPNLMEFRKISNELSNIGKDLKDKIDHLLLHNLSDPYKEVKTGFKYARDNISLDLVISHLRTRELKLRTEKLHISGSGSGGGGDVCIRGLEVEKEAKVKTKKNINQNPMIQKMR